MRNSRYQVHRSGGGKELPRSEALKHAIRELDELGAAYEAFFRRPQDDERWRRLDTAATAATAAVRSSAVAELVDPRITTHLKERRSAPAEALKALDALDEVLAKEQRLAAGMGFSRKEFKVFCNQARKALTKARDRHDELPQGRSTDLLAKLLTTVHLEVAVTFDRDSSLRPDPRPTAGGTSGLPRRRKSAERRDASNYARRGVFVVGTVVADADFPFFALSYSLFLGVSASRGRRRKLLRRKPRRLIDALDATA